jgi:hypothetical protein
LKILLLALLSLAVVPTYAGTVTGTLQGPSGIPVKNGTLNFQLNQAGLIVGTGAVVPTTASCYTDSSGNVVGLPNMLTAPTAAPNYGSGSLPGGIYYVQQTFTNASGETAPSPELRIQMTSTGTLQINPPTSIPAGATGIKVYAATTSGQEQAQGVQTTTAVFNLTALNVGVSPPASNNTVCQIAFNDTIIPFTGYTVSLISSGGNAYPGYPQSWQLSGGLAGTVNISSGAPLWNGVVVYPQPLLSQPLNHGPQSISGNLDHGGYNDTNIGILTAGQINSVVNANLQTGSDIGAKINTALTSCAFQCTVYVPAGAYSFSTTIQIPMGVVNTYTLQMDKGAVLTYTGTGDAIYAYPSAGPSYANMTIEGGQLIGTHGGNGVHLVASSFINIHGMAIIGFTNGLLLDGPNDVNIQNNYIHNNGVGIYLEPTFCNGTTCTPTYSAGLAAYTTNAIHIENNSIAFNGQWAIYDGNTSPGNTGSFNNLIKGNNLEDNGIGTPTYGAVYIARGTGYHIVSNYFEGSPRQIVLGTPPIGSPFYFSAQSTNIDANYFTVSTATPYQIELEDAIYTQINGNTVDIVTSNGSNCFINITGENHTYVGQNQYGGAGSLMCSGGSAIQVLTGQGSSSFINTYFLVRNVYQNFAITNSTSDVVPGQFVVPGSACYATPGTGSAGNVATWQSIIAQVYVIPNPTTPGSATIYHPTGDAGYLYNVWCAGPFNI